MTVQVLNASRPSFSSTATLPPPTKPVAFPDLPMSVTIYSPEAFKESSRHISGYLSLDYDPQMRYRKEPWQLTYSTNLYGCGGTGMDARSHKEGSKHFLDAANLPELFRDEMIPRFCQIRQRVADLMRKEKVNQPKKFDLKLPNGSPLVVVLSPYPMPNNPGSITAKAIATIKSPKLGGVEATVEQCSDPRVIRLYRWRQNLPSGYSIHAVSSFFKNKFEKRKKAVQ